MADNITITEGTAKAIAADDVSDVFYQKIKLDMGADGLSSPFTGTITEITNVADGTVVVGTVPGIGVLSLGTVKVTEGSAVLKGGTITTILAGTQELLGTVANLGKGTITKIEGGTIGNLASGSVVITDGTIGDMDTIGTIGVIEGGSVVVTAGTISDMDTVGTVGRLEGGTLGLTTRVGNLGTVENLNQGTVTRIEGGSIVVTAGTVTTSMGDLSGGTIDNIAGGSIVVTAGTVVTTMGDLSGGTIDAITAGTVTVGGGTVTTILAGTQELLGTVANLAKGTITSVGTVVGLGAVGNLGAGTITTLVSGTVAKVTNLAAGTITRLEGGTLGILTNGTIQVGNLGAGTITKLEGGTLGILTNGTVQVGNLGGGTVQIDTKPVQNVETYGTLVDAAGAEFGTLLESSGAGTYHYIHGMSIVCHSGTVDSYLGYGSSITGTGVIARGIFSEGGGGIARDFDQPLFGGGTNTEVIYKIGGAGTVMYTINYRTGT